MNFAVFIKIYLRPCGCSNTTFMAMVNHVNQKLKYKLKSLIDKSLKFKPGLSKQVILFARNTLLFKVDSVSYKFPTAAVLMKTNSVKV